MNYTIVIFASLAIAGSCVLVSGRKGVRWGFLLWICSLALGYRTYTLTPALKLHPSALLLVGVFLWLAATASSRVRTEWWVPAWVWAMVPFWYWGWILGRGADAQWDEMFSELQNFILFIPLFIVAATVVRKTQDWKNVVMVFYVTATFVAALGLLEFFFPSIRGIFPQFVSNTDPYVSEDGFMRAPFSFWGHQAATFLCAMAMPFIIPIWNWRPGHTGHVFTVMAFALLLGAVYLSGFRVLWLFTGAQFLLWLMFNRRYALGIMSGVVAITAYSALPEATQLRAQSFILALQGTPVETSGADHLNRLSDALNAVRDYPFGMGWTVSGWVHCDFVQVAANLGLIPGLLFAGAFLWTGFSLFRLVRERGNINRPLHLALFLSFATAGGIMSTQVICVLPQLACPVWFIWALAAVAVRQQGTERRESRRVNTNLRFAPHVQLREHHPEHVGISAQRI
ncbi:MAG TPA: hypothetical protein VGN17_22285 [Bryobacteraceae bacterium]|jgi:hypothetical protein